jgi:hypothetical protein
MKTVMSHHFALSAPFFCHRIVLKNKQFRCFRLFYVKKTLVELRPFLLVCVCVKMSEMREVN